MTRRSWAIFFLGMAVFGVLLLLVFGIITAATKSTEIRDTQEQRAPFNEANDETLRIIKGCTTPGMRCYERTQRQTARAVGDVNRVIVLAAACASGSTIRTQVEIQACVLRGLADKKEPR